MAVLAVAAAGAAIGAGIGAATTIGVSLGMSIGWAIGSYVGQMLFAPEQRFEGPRLSDLQVQSSTDGSPLPIAYGTVRLPGKVFWATQIKETQHEEEVGGKGGFGGGSTNITYSYSVSMAVSLSEGPILGIRRIWADSKLVFSIADGATPATFVANAEHGAITVYTGSETQTADATISAEVGAGNTPGYRGTAYMVFTNWQLKDFANHMPFIEAEVVVSGSASITAFEFEVGSPPVEDVSRFALDQRRGTGYYSENNPTAGEAIWKWTFGASQPEVFVLYTAELIASLENTIYGLVIHEDQDWLIVHGGGVGNGVPYLAFDLSSGALVTQGQSEAAGFDLTGTSEQAILRTRLYYDGATQFKYLWGLSDGFASADLYLTRFIPTSGDLEHFVVDNSGNTANPNHSPMIDASGKLWLITPFSIVKAVVPPIVFTLPVTGVPGQAFMWASRQEIWVPRATGQSTSGWMVFDLSAETFDDSINLFGGNTFTGDFEFAIENQNGAVWFAKPDGSGIITATLRDTTGAEVNSIAGTVDFDNANWNNLEYVPGIVVVNMDSKLGCWFEDVLEPGTAPLDEVVDNLCLRVGLTATDTSALALDGVRGFIVARPMSARNAIEPLQMAFGFDGVESDAVMRFVKRGGASVVTIPQDDLAAREGGLDAEPPDEFIRTRALETELPATIHLRYINQTTDYNIAAETARRLTTGAKNTFETELPIVLTSQEANRVADTLMRLSWLERVRISFSVGPKYSFLDPTDVVTLYDGTRIRLVSTSQDTNGIITCEGVSDDDAALISYATGSVDEVAGAITLGSEGVTVPAIIDGPLLLDRHVDVGWILGACGEYAGWGGGAMYQSKDGGVTFAGVAALSTAARIGTVVSGSLPALPVGESNVWDHAGSITVKLAQPDLTISTPSSLEAFYQQENAFLISDNWEDCELAQGYTVTANADGTYTMTDLLRGRKGTEQFAGPWGVGAKVIFADVTRLVNVAESLTELGFDQQWKAVTTGGNIIDEISRTRTFDAVAAKPLSPVEIGGARNANGDIVIEWVRRARFDADWRSGGGAALDETIESYEVEIWDDGYSDLKRTLSVDNASTVTYTDAMNASDFGSPSAGYIAVRVYQISDRVGRGYPGNARVGDLPALPEFGSLVTGGFTVGVVPAHRRRVVRSGSSQEWAPCSRTYATGKWYWELLIENGGTGTDCAFGISSKPTYATGDSTSTSLIRVWRGNGSFLSDGAGSPNTTGEVIDPTSQVVRFAWDALNGLLWIGYGAVWLTADPETGAGHNTSHTAGLWRPVVVSSTAGVAFTITASFQRGNVYRPPAGFRLID